MRRIDRKTLDSTTASLGGDVLVVQGDVRNLADIDRLFAETVNKFGKIDMLVANAGIAKFAPVDVMPEALFDELNNIMYKGVFFTVQKALPRRIRVNVMSPDMTDTPIITREGGIPGTTPEELAAMIIRGIPMKRRGSPKEMAKGMVFLACDDSSYCLGMGLMCDGGLTQLVNPN